MASTKLFSRIRGYNPSLWALFTFASWIPPWIFLNTYVAEIPTIEGPSMYPYLNPDYDRSLRQDRCLSWKWRATEGLERGMIVTFWSPYNPEVQAIKRIIALEGDQVYTRAPYPHPVAQVPPGHVWVEGDDKKRTLDSNTYGPISKNLITGKVIYVIWPWSSFGRVQWELFNSKTRIKKGKD